MLSIIYISLSNNQHDIIYGHVRDSLWRFRLPYIYQFICPSCCRLYFCFAGIPMDNTCASLVADLFLFCHERDFVQSLSDINRANVIEASTSISRYLNGLLNIDITSFEQMGSHIYPTELQLNKTNSSDTGRACADPESFVRGGPKINLIKIFVCVVGDGIEDPNTAINGPSSARQRNAI